MTEKELLQASQLYGVPVSHLTYGEGKTVVVRRPPADTPKLKTLQEVSKPPKRPMPSSDALQAMADRIMSREAVCKRCEHYNSKGRTCDLVTPGEGCGCSASSKFQEVLTSPSPTCPRNKHE